MAPGPSRPHSGSPRHRGSQCLFLGTASEQQALVTFWCQQASSALPSPGSRGARLVTCSPVTAWSHPSPEVPDAGLARQCRRSRGRGPYPAPSPGLSPLPGSPQMPASVLLNEESSSPRRPPLLPKWIYRSAAPSSPLPLPSPLTGLRGKWRVLLYILADCSPYAPVSLGWDWGDGGVSKLYIELLTGAEALWFPWQPGWK